MKNDDVSEGSRELVDLSAEAQAAFFFSGAVAHDDLPLSPHLMRLVLMTDTATALEACEAVSSLGIHLAQIGQIISKHSP